MRQRLFLFVTLLLVAVIAVLLWRFTHSEKPKALQEALPITTYTLSNGLTLVVVENHRVPAVSHTMFVRVGAADDPLGKSGLAHYVEHMMYKGTKTVDSGEYDRRVGALGGENNAYTTSDFTAYYVNAPVGALEQVMALEADRFMNLVVRDDEAKTELKIIEEERKMRIDSDPSSILGEQMDAVQFLMHPYRIPIIGWEQDIEKLTASDLVKFMNAHYKPNNMVLVIAGDVEPKAVRRLAMRYWGSMRKENAIARAWASEPAPVAARSVTYRDARVKRPQWIKSYSAISLGTADAKDVIALELVAQWLGGGRTGYLYQALVVEQGLAVDIGAGFGGSRVGPGTFSIRAIPKDGVTMRQLGDAIDATLKQALLAGPDNDSITRAKTLYTADITYAQDGLTPVASYIGTLAMLGKDAEFFYGLGKLIDSVTAVDMQNVAQKVLIEKAAVTGELLPEEVQP